MADTTITGASALSPLAATDVVAVARPADSTKYKATAAAIKDYVESGDFVTPANTGNGTWASRIGEVTWFTHKNQVLRWGYNNSNIGGGQEDAALPSMLIGFETDYYTDETTHISEWYVSWIAPGGGTIRRTIHITWDIPTGTTQIALNADVILFRDVDGVEKSRFTPTGWTDITHAANKGSILADRSDGHTYRIKCTAGVLGVEQVT
jgi:hypothetical protein